MPTNPSFLRLAPRSFAVVFGFILSVVGTASLVASLYTGAVDRALNRDGVVVTGTVLDKRVEHLLRQKRGGGTELQTKHVVRYRFTSHAGSTHEGERAVGQPLWARLIQGGPIAIRFLEDDPFANRPDLEPGPQTDPFLIAGAVVGSVGLLVLAAGIQTLRGLVALLRDGVPMEADITAIDRRVVRRRTTYRLRYHYQVSGESYGGTSLALNEKEVAGWRVGDRGRIRVDAAQPRRSAWVGAIDPGVA